jgi:hypothetical protein
VVRLKETIRFHFALGRVCPERVVQDICYLAHALRRGQWHQSRVPQSMATERYGFRSSIALAFRKSTGTEF